MAEHNFVGKIGEDLARKFLEKNGYKILEQNYKTRFAEIDLIAEKQEKFLWRNPFASRQKELVFVEVRTKVREQFGSPEDTINKFKLKKVLQNSKSYLGFKKWQGPARIDAVCIVLNSDFSVLRLTHHKNIIS